MQVSDSSVTKIGSHTGYLSVCWNVTEMQFNNARRFYDLNGENSFFDL